jgi:uncharacterized membrane protein YcaP (DUF421 family)
MGRKELSQMTFFNFVSAITIGSIAANLAVNPSMSTRNGVIALVGWSAFTILMGFIDIKSRTARKFLEGTPIVLIQNGKILEDSLKKVRIDVDALVAMLRQNKVFSLMDVDYAIYETNGRLSVIKKDYKQFVTKADMQIPSPDQFRFPIETHVITDGKINKQNLRKLNLDEKWLEQQLQQAGVNSVSKVFFAEVQKDGSLYIDNKDENIH